LRRGESDVRAIAAEEAGIAVVEFFAFELRGDADDGDDDIGFACGGESLIEEIRWKPEQVDRGFPGVVEVFELDGIGVAGLKVNESGHGAVAVGCPVVDEEFVVEVETGAAVGTDTEAVIAVNGRD